MTTTKFYTTQRLGLTRRLTPEGFLVVEGATLARVGDQEYGPEEVPVDPGKDGKIHVGRSEEEVFREKTIASANGKSICIEHPDEDVDPRNWKQYEVGTIINPRRGTGDDADCLVADLIIKDAGAIAAVKAGKKELSLGYDADYIDLGNGKGEQKNILINHVALVDIGRCGPRCSIGDRKRRPAMARRSWLDSLRNAFKDGDEDKVKELMEKAPAEVKDAATDQPGGGGDTHIHIGGDSVADRRTRDDDEDDPRWAQNEADHQEFRDSLDDLTSRMEKLEGGGATDTAARDAAAAAEGDKEIEGELEEEAPPGTGDKAVKARDSAYLDDSFQSTVAQAEILAPGIRIPTFDKALDPKKTFGTINTLRCRALDSAYATEAGKTIIDEITGRTTLDTGKMKPALVRTVFRAAAAAMRLYNNSRRTDDTADRGTIKVGGTIQSNSDFNAAARKKWGQSAAA